MGGNGGAGGCGGGAAAGGTAGPCGVRGCLVERRRDGGILKGSSSSSPGVVCGFSGGCLSIGSLTRVVGRGMPLFLH